MLRRKRWEYFVYPAIGTLIALLICVSWASNTSTRAWAKQAPLITIKVHQGDTGWSLIKDQLPERLQQTENIGQLLEDVSSRTGEKLTGIKPGKVLQLPIPYEEWASGK